MQINYIDRFREIPCSPNMGELLLFTTKVDDFARLVSVLTDSDLSYGINIRQYCVDDVFDLDDDCEVPERVDRYFEILADKIDSHFETNIGNFTRQHPCGVVLIAESDEQRGCWYFKILTPSRDFYIMKDGSTFSRG